MIALLFGFLWGLGAGSLATLCALHWLGRRQVDAMRDTIASEIRAELEKLAPTKDPIALPRAPGGFQDLYRAVMNDSEDDSDPVIH